MGNAGSTKKTHGGARPGAGRKKSVRRGGPHRARPELSKRHPVHVTLRLNRFELRNGTVYRVIHRVLAVLLDAPDFRVVHISIQNNHLHLIVEANNKRALTRGMQRFSIRTARELQEALGHRGKIFPWRYHAKQITTPRQARNALAYVLNNWRRHREDLPTAQTRAAKLDPYSSGIRFDGWIGAPRFQVPEYYVPLPLPLPVSAPTTALLAHDWRRWACEQRDVMARCSSNALVTNQRSTIHRALERSHSTNHRRPAFTAPRNAAPRSTNCARTNSANFKGLGASE